MEPAAKAVWAGEAVTAVPVAPVVQVDNPVWAVPAVQAERPGPVEHRANPASPDSPDSPATRTEPVRPNRSKRRAACSDCEPRRTGQNCPR